MKTLSAAAACCALLCLVLPAAATAQTHRWFSPAIPDHAIYWELFHRVAVNADKADAAERRGQDRSSLKQLVRRHAELSEEQGQQLEQIARECARGVAATDAEAWAIIDKFHREHPYRPISKNAPVPSPPPELIRVSQRRIDLILAGRDQLRSVLRHDRFVTFDRDQRASTRIIARPQDVGIAYTSTDIDWDEYANTIEASCSMFLDYVAALYYDSAVSCHIYHDGNNPAHIVASNWGYGTSYIDIALEYADPVYNVAYSTQGTYFVSLPYYSGGDGGDFHYSNEQWSHLTYKTRWVGRLDDSVTTAPGPPVKLRVVDDNVGLPRGDESTGVVVRQMRMQLVDASNRPIKRNVFIMETYDQLPMNTCTKQQIPSPTNCRLTGEGEEGTGQFIDTLRAAPDRDLRNATYHDSDCGYTLIATWRMCDGSTNELWTSQRVTHANEISVDGNRTGYRRGTIIEP